MDVSHLLANAQDKAREHPLTFDVPPADELANITPGDGVKICIEGVERFWTVVDRVEGTTVWAKVDNALICLDWQVGEMLRFQLHHVYDVSRSR